MRFHSPAVDEYLQDPFLRTLSEELEAAGPIKPIVVDITHVCNIRCKGCYFFAEHMDATQAPKEEDVFDAFIVREQQRGTNYMTVVGGEPALQLARLKKLHETFHVLPYTNGMLKIPWNGFEAMPIAISLWGGHTTDTLLRGNGKIDIFARSLVNYKDDPRVVWYYTTTPGNADEIETVVEEIVANGNLIQFSFYEDHSELGGAFDHRQGFASVRAAIDRMIERHPEHILTTSYLNRTATTNQLFDQRWGHAVCPVVSADNAKNAQRVQNGNRYSPHMRVYLPDLTTTRRCPVGEDHDCGACYNVLARMTWIVINQHLHLGSVENFTDWLTSTYAFYTFVGKIPRAAGARHLAEIHRRGRRWRDEGRAAATGWGEPSEAVGGR
jgi:organic radical activating enzyme